VKVEFSTYIAPLAAYAPSAALCVKDWVGIYPRPQSKPTLTDFWPAAVQPYIDIVCHVNGLHTL